MMANVDFVSLVSSATQDEEDPREESSASRWVCQSEPSSTAPTTQVSFDGNGSVVIRFLVVVVVLRGVQSPTVVLFWLLNLKRVCKHTLVLKVVPFFSGSQQVPRTCT